MRRPHLALLTCVLSGTLLAGCGDDDTMVIDRPIIRFELAEYRIAPQDVTIKPGRIKIDARNTGRLPHNLAIQTETEDEEGEKEWTDVPGGRTETVQPGRRAQPIKVTLRPGDYRLVCTIANHDDLGQYGELHVEE